MIKHGHSKRSGKSKVYGVWRAMMQRCYRPNDKSFAYYGGRGISVCQAWHEFAGFLADMGEPALGMTLERLDVNGNYCRENCSWAPWKDQASNKSNTVFLSHEGQRMPLQAWAEKTGINYNCLRARVAKGWSAEKALTTPLMSVAQRAKLGADQRWAQRK